jgi:hypothetical protein
LELRKERGFEAKTFLSLWIKLRDEMRKNKEKEKEQRYSGRKLYRIFVPSLRIIQSKHIASSPFTTI